MQTIDNTKLVANWVNVKKLNENAQLPTQGSEWSAGWDLYACIDEPISINPHTTVKIGTGLAFELPKYTFGGIFPRSGLATKKGLRPANTPGVCDSDYRGEYIVALHNDSESIQWVEPGERIAQLIVLPYVPIQFNLVDSLSETERGAGGFGSTGSK
jgi:dUTP pyrophosphatase